MTIQKISGQQNYTGLSTDSKSTTEYPGSTFFETDTGLKYVYGADGWGVTAESLAGGDISIGNSSADALIEDAVFTGEVIDITDSAIITLNVYSDVASAEDGLLVMQSSDGINFDHIDSYTVPAATGKIFTPNKAASFLKIQYTNGSVAQTAFRLQTIVNYVNGKASSHRVDDDITSQDDAELVIAVLKVPTNDPTTLKNVDVQNPLPTDGDSVYAKDMELDNSSIPGFTGDVESLFNDYEAEIENVNATNPKIITVRLKRPVTTSKLGVGSRTGDFSNVKIELKDLAGTVRGGIDDSSNNTKLTSAVYPFSPVTFIEMVIEFHTADTVTISGLFVPKDISSVSRIQGQKPDGTIVDFEATAGGNFKISLEERDPAVVLDDMLEIPRGNITGITSVNKYGRAEDGVQTTPTDIWDGAPSQPIWLAPTAARIHTIVSDAAADDGTPEGAGAGAQAVRVWYLPDWDTVETTEDVILNGIAGVAMNNASVMINRVKVIPVGVTYNNNVGTITATAAVDGTITSQINPGNGQTNQAIYGLPSIQIAYATGFNINSHNTANPGTAIEVDFTLLANEHPDLNTTVFLNKGNLGTRTTGSTNINRKYKPYRRIDGPAIMKIQGTATTADTEATSEFDLIIVDN